MPELVRAHSYHHPSPIFPSQDENSSLYMSLELFEYHLDLRSAFGTSHSSTTRRKNALIRISIHSRDEKIIFDGFGECGLPPKKANCYLADFNDIQFYFEQFCENLKVELQKNEFNWKEMIGNAFKNVDEKYFTLVRKLADENASLNGKLQSIPLILLNGLDQYEYLDQIGEKHPEFEHCAQCGIEMAIFDLWGKILDKPLYNLIGIEPPVQKFAFYTAALNEDIGEIVKTARFGLEKTRHLKMKLDSDIEKGILILKNLIETYEKDYIHENSKPHWSIDANSAWTPETSLEFLQQLKEKLPNFLPYFYMLEQPFPILVESSESSKWEQVKQAYENEGILIFADESVNTFENIANIQSFIHGINIKLEKSGGIRGALTVSELAKKHYNLKLWFGCMVSSRLSCTCSSHLMSLAEIGGDLDGSLLVAEHSQGFEGGFDWRNDQVSNSESRIGRNHGEIVLLEKPGIGVDIKKDTIRK
ncbi:chloromuconate cycloisomerase [Naegleria gruberi]|uniref:Chloromuconate cycloisomerase n=1 Tax=Naegleria gruberi TaxID=5762 RepID=D2VZL2_NAEGR|nr:chloromuconate cycloisomerase [Naegleria gruberi]EFC37677.1 chloromuconate cycloisomerase [Naegleria gruberi]|eukprot:XP_002670421.1 chloromuconate cycloisomerase [Naegleria gruberi strain NEG-M]